MGPVGVPIMGQRAQTCIVEAVTIKSSTTLPRTHRQRGETVGIWSGRREQKRDILGGPAEVGLAEGGPAEGRIVLQCEDDSK